MSNRIQDEILFGLIAVKEGFLTQELLDQALDIQERSTSTRGVTLGHILVELGFLKAEQVHQIVAIQNRNLAQRDPNTGEQRADSLFGRLAVKCGFTTADRMHECVRLQAELARKGSPARLGRLLVDKGRLPEMRQVVQPEVRRPGPCPPLQALRRPPLLPLRDLLHRRGGSAGGCGGDDARSGVPGGRETENRGNGETVRRPGGRFVISGRPR